MQERIMMTSFTLVDPTEANAIGALEFYWDCMFDITIVGVSVAPDADDAGPPTLDIDDDGSNIITAISCADANVPGTWKSTHITGGTETPVFVAAGSKMAFDVNSATAATAFHVVLYYLMGSGST